MQTYRTLSDPEVRAAYVLFEKLDRLKDRKRTILSLNKRYPGSALDRSSRLEELEQSIRKCEGQLKPLWNCKGGEHGKRELSCKDKGC